MLRSFHISLAMKQSFSMVILVINFCAITCYNVSCCFKAGEHIENEHIAFKIK